MEPKFLPKGFDIYTPYDYFSDWCIRNEGPDWDYQRDEKDLKDRKENEVFNYFISG